MIFSASGSLYFIDFGKFSNFFDGFQQSLEYLVQVSFLFSIDENLILVYLSILFFQHLGGFCEFSVVLYLVYGLAECLELAKQLLVLFNLILELQMFLLLLLSH